MKFLTLILPLLMFFSCAHIQSEKAPEGAKANKLERHSKSLQEKSEDHTKERWPYVMA